MKKRFEELFAVQNGMILPKAAIHVNGVTFTPGVSFGGGVSLGGVDLTKLIGKDLEVTFKDGVYVITGVYS